MYKIFKWFESAYAKLVRVYLVNLSNAFLGFLLYLENRLCYLRFLLCEIWVNFPHESYKKYKTA
jgi:hypothetical protein